MRRAKKYTKKIDFIFGVWYNEIRAKKNNSLPTVVLVDKEVVALHLYLTMSILYYSFLEIATSFFNL